MAMRFRYVQPQYGGQVSPLTSSLGKVFEAFMSGPSQFEIDKLGSETDFNNLKSEGLRREYRGNDAAADLIGGNLPYDPQSYRKVVGELTRGGRKSTDVGGLGLVYTTAAPGATVTQRDTAQIGAHMPYSATETATRMEDTTKRRGQDVAAGTAITTQRMANEAAMDRTSVEFVDPADGKVKTTTVRQLRERGLTPVLKDGMMSVVPTGNVDRPYEYQPNVPGMRAPTPSSDKDRFVVSPDGRGGATYQPVRPDLPAFKPGSGTMTPRNYVAPDGSRGITLDGVTDAQSGKPLPAGSSVVTMQLDDFNKLPRGEDAKYVSAQTANIRLKDDITRVRDLIKSAPASVGPVGILRRTLQDAIQVGDLAAQQLGMNVQAVRDQVGRLDPSLAANFDPRLPQVDLMLNLIAYRAASALAGQQGRDVSNQDYKRFKEMVGDSSTLGNPAEITARLNLVEQLVDQELGRLGTLRSGGQVAPQPAPPLPSSSPYQPLAPSAPPGSPANPPPGRTRINMQGQPIR